jgi:undecaprenyl diphosphate synthase
MSEQNAPRCIGIILDGNRRWAKKKDLPAVAGHAEGRENAKRIARAAARRGIEDIVMFVFSTENWKRAEKEVSDILDLFADGIASSLDELVQEGVRVRFLGQLELFSDKLRSAMRDLEEKSKAGTKTLWLCVSYGARAEMLDAAKKLKESSEEFNEQNLRKNFWSAEMPDPDLIIRAGGEKRLSNFLLWQAAYSELFFTETLWPDFSEEELDAILKEYAARKRNFGI